jgi:hypothetical protein
VDYTQTNQLHEIGFIKLETAHMVQSKNIVILNCRSRRERLKVDHTQTKSVAYNWFHKT